MVKLSGENTANGWLNDGTHDYRLEIEALNDDLGNPINVTPSLTDFKAMVEHGDVFIVDTTNATDPDNWRIDDTDGLYQENFPTTEGWPDRFQSKEYDPEVFASIDSQDAGGVPSATNWVINFTGGVDEVTDDTTGTTDDTTGTTDDTTGTTDDTTGTTDDTTGATDDTTGAKINCPAR